MRIFKKWTYAFKKRIELNKNNPAKLYFEDNIIYRIETSLNWKFFISTVLIFMGIFLANSALNHFDIFNFNFHLPDNDSARYFYSAVVQSLAALLAISFSILNTTP